MWKSIYRKYPDFSADCFRFPEFKNFTPGGPYSCTSNTKANCTNNGSILCFSWVIASQGMNDVFNVLDTCGGLLGIVGSII
jgi:hypothetical protein